MMWYFSHAANVFCPIVLPVETLRFESGRSRNNYFFESLGRTPRCLIDDRGKHSQLGPRSKSFVCPRRLLIGVPLLVTAILMREPTMARWCAFSASYAATAGMLYGSFFGKLVDLSRPVSSNIEIRLLTALIGLAFLSSLIGLIASIHLSSRGLSRSRG